MKLKRTYEIIRKKFFKRESEIYLAVILCLQVVILITLLFTSVIRPKSAFEYNLAGFGRNMEFTQIEGEQRVLSENISLMSGAYQFRVIYESDSDGTGDCTKSTGSIAIESGNPDLESYAVPLDDGHNQAVGNFWIPSFTHCEDLHFVVRYNGTGTLKISSCKVSEALGYRFVRFIGYIVLFVLLDAAYLIFFSDLIVSRKSAAGIVAIIIIAFISSIPYIDDVLYIGHDIKFHLMRIVALAQGLSEGQFPVRIATELNNGYGYANSLYYCDIFLYMSALLYVLRVPLRVCYQVYVILANGFTALFTYYATTKYTNRILARVIGTMLYMLCAYRLSNINIRAALGEFTAMSFLPLVIVGFHNVLTKENIRMSDWFPLAAGMSGVIMSHIITAEMLVLNILLLLILTICRVFNYKRLIAILKAALTSVMMTAWFIVPFADSIMSQSTVVQNERRQLWRSTEQWSSLLEIFAPGNNCKNYRSLGLAFIVGALLVLYCLYIWKTSEEKNGKENDRLSEFRLLGLLTGVNVFFASSSFPWNKTQTLLGDFIGTQLGTIQFPWRFLSIAAALLAVAVVIALDYIAENKKQLYRSASVLMAASILLGCGYFYFSYYDYSVAYKYPSLEGFTASDNLYYLQGTNGDNCKVSKVQVKEGSAEVISYVKEKGWATLELRNTSAAKEAKVSVPIFAYENYHVMDLRDESNIVDMHFEKDDFNCIQITVPPSFEGDIQIRYKEPLLWRLAEIISLLSYAFLIYILLIKEKGKCGLHYHLKESYDSIF